MSKVKGRTDDMLVVRGVNVFPSQIEEVILAVEGVEPQYLILVDRARNELDSLDVWVEASPQLWRATGDCQSGGGAPRPRSSSDARPERDRRGASAEFDPAERRQGATRD